MESTPSSETPIWSPIPGPLNRADFFDEQRRRRAETGRYTVLTGVTAALAGVPLAMFLTPVVFLIVIGALRVIEQLASVPEAVWSGMRSLAGFMPAFLDAFSNAPDPDLLPTLRYATSSVTFPFGSPFVTVAALLVPGMAGMVAIWMGYRALFRRAGIGGSLRALAAREPRLEELEERQLVNVVEEMAIAAGLPPPAVRLIDSPAPNAAAIGSSHEDAVLIISRGLLERLDREETQGVIGHLIGSVGNGDLGMALSITTLFQAIELVFTVMDALFNLSLSAWRDLGWTLRLLLTGGHDQRAADVVARMMERPLGDFREDGITSILDKSEHAHPTGFLPRLLKRLPMLYVVVFPFLLLYLLTMFLRMQVTMFRMTFVGPLLLKTWKTRRFLADATAVQLTRNPEGLASALGHLAEEGAVVPGGQWFSHLFIVGPEVLQARSDAALQQRMAQLRERSGGAGAVHASAAEGVRAVREQAKAADGASEKTWAKELAGVASHPSILARVQRLGALGARIGSGSAPSAKVPRAAPPAASWPGWTQRAALGTVGAIILVPLMAIVFVLMAFVMSAIFMFGFIAAVFFMGLAMAGIFALLT